MIGLHDAMIGLLITILQAGQASTGVEPWTIIAPILAALPAAAAATYAVVSARKSNQAAHRVEQERVDLAAEEATAAAQLAHDEQILKSAGEHLAQVERSCERCTHDLVDAREKLVQAYTLIGQHQEREQQYQARERELEREIADLRSQSHG